MSTLRHNDKLFIPLIGVLSVVVPVVVAALLYADKPNADMFGDVSFLPLLNAVINSTVAVLLVLGLVFIRKKNIRLHRTTMVSALVLSTLFLVSYIIYHYGAESVKYGGEGLNKYVYLFILATHIVLSVVVVPLALLSIYRGFTNQIAKHKRLTRWTWPIWFYVAVTGVVVYLFAHVYNPIDPTMIP